MEQQELPQDRWFWVWLSIFAVVLGTSPLIIWDWKQPLWGTLCGVIGLAGLLMLVRDRLMAAASKLTTSVSLKVLAVLILSMLLGQLMGYDIYHHAKVAPSPIYWWGYGLALLLIAVVVSAALAENKEPSKLVIHSATYRAIENGGQTYDVADFLRMIISGDSLVFDIENDNFVFGHKNFVPHDPLRYKPKRLQVTYSYGDQPASPIVRYEHDRLVLPEDSMIKRLTNDVEQLKKQTVVRVDTQERHYPRNVFTIQRVIAEPPSASPTVVYKDKLRVILTNHLDREVQVWTPLWQSPDVHPQSPFGSLLRLEGPKGWKFDDWKDEVVCCTLPIGFTFSCWIGLLPPTGKSIERRVQTQTQVGTAIFPVKIDGKLYEVPIEL